MVVTYDFSGVPTPEGIILRPYLPVSLRYKENDEIDTYMLVDSGADYSMIERAMAEVLNIPVDSLSTLENPISGVTGTAQVVQAKIEVSFGYGPDSFVIDDMPIQIPLKRGIPPVGLLGRIPLFYDFDITFRMGYTKDQGRFSLKEVTRRRSD